MLIIQATPAPGCNAFRLLRSRIKDAATWNWTNKGKTRLRHVKRLKGGYIDVADGGGVLVAHVHPAEPADLFYLAEKFIGRLVAWFEGDLVAISVHFAPEPPPPARRRRRTTPARGRAGRRPRR